MKLLFKKALFSLLFFSLSISYGQDIPIPKRGILFEDNGVKIELGVIVPKKPCDSSSSRKAIYCLYITNAKDLQYLKPLLNWKMHFVNCNNEIIEQTISVNISDLKEGQNNNIDWSFQAVQVEKYFFDVVNYFTENIPINQNVSNELQNPKRNAIPKSNNNQTNSNSVNSNIESTNSSAQSNSRSDDRFLTCNVCAKKIYYGNIYFVNTGLTFLTGGEIPPTLTMVPGKIVKSFLDEYGTETYRKNWGSPIDRNCCSEKCAAVDRNKLIKENLDEKKQANSKYSGTFINCYKCEKRIYYKQTYYTADNYDVWKKDYNQNADSYNLKWLYGKRFCSSKCAQGY